MNEHDYETDVCIIGAGPAGALLSFLLASQNISVILMERNEHINKEFRGEHLNETGEEILKRYGLFEELEDIGLLRMDRLEYWNEGELYKAIYPGKKVDHVGIHVPQSHLLGLLMKKSTSFPKFKLMLKTKVVGLLEEEEHFTGVKAIQNDKEIIIKSKLIVGADGRFSSIRKLAEIPFQKISHGYDLLWARIPAPPSWEPVIKIANVNNHQVALFTQQGGNIQIGWNIEEGSFPQLRKQSFLSFIEQLIQAFPKLKDCVTEHIQSWDDFVLLKVQSCSCKTWVKDNLVIIGDAAHTMSPTGAFGINSAMKDADVLYEIIMEKGSIDHLDLSDLKWFEQYRRKEVEFQQRQQLEKEASFGNLSVPV